MFSTVEYSPATASTRALRVMRARCRWAMSLATVAEHLETGAPRRSRRLTFERGTGNLCLRPIVSIDSASLADISVARVPRWVPVVSWSSARPSSFQADPSRLEGPRRSTILVETAADRRDTCCERAARLRRHVLRVERAARREATISCLTATLWL